MDGPRSTRAVFVGSYERFVFRYELRNDNEGDVATSPISVDATRFRKTASHAAHSGPVKCLKASENFVFSGGAGGVVRVYDPKTGLDEDFLTVPDAESVCCLVPFSVQTQSRAERLLTGSANGHVHVFFRNNREWQHHRCLSFHRSAVNGVDVHLSSKMAFTVGQDCSLVLWDLLSYKRGFSCKLAIEAEQVVFHPHQEEAYFLSYRNTVARCSLRDPGAFSSWRQTADVQSMRVWKRHRFLTASDDGAVRLWDERHPELAMEIPDAHRARIKGIDTLSEHRFVSGASDGELKLWDLRKTKNSVGCEAVGCEDTGARITCLIGARSAHHTTQKGQRERM